ncbi:TonB-dependent receptor domain-containing protein [Thalassovita sp.]|uniref:TonB-dependent receptor domain-containing protein n=1 Tax=Thalassovita sp. TaxID=1979401 RepID=UPI002AB18973|nr:TonB-dependent receptor [Thalassovita sp.]
MTLTARALLLASAASLTAAPLWAQEIVTPLEEIRIDSDAAQSLLGNAEITEEDLENRNPASLQDVFAGETAVTASGGAAIGQKVYVKGIEESLLSVTIDGARQNKSAFHHTGNVLIDPELLKSVEVTSGLAPADAGAGALAGTIAYTTKNALDLLEPGETFGGYASYTHGDNGFGNRGSVALFGQQGGFDYLLSVARHKGEDYEDGDGRVVEGTQADLTDLNLKLGFTTEGGNRLSFAASKTEDTGLRAAQPGPFGALFIRPDFFGTLDRTTQDPVDNVLVEGLSRRTSYTLTWDDDGQQDGFSPFVQLSYNEQEIDAIGVAGVNKSLSGVIKDDFALSNGVVTAGIDFFRETAEGWMGPAIPPTLGGGEEELRNIGVFAQARQEFGERVSVSYGARFDVQNFDAANGETFKSNGASVNASVDVILTDALTLNAGAASTWGGYELGEAALINFFTPWDYTGFTTSRSKSARVGLRYEMGALELSGAFFRTEINDLNAVLPSSGARGATADITTQGFDAALRYDLGNGFVGVNYTFADVERDGDQINSISYYLGRPMGHIFGLEAVVDATENLRIGVSAEIALDYDETEDVAGMNGLEGYEVVNVFAEYTPPSLDNMTLRFEVRNLLNQTYTTRGADGAGAAENIQPLTEPGRTLALTAKMRF